jgi:Terminase large subunit, T4likevirus-type, N-terminal
MGLATNLALVCDPALIMQTAGWTPDLWQAELLRGRYHRAMLNCSRQIGKSTTVGSEAMNEALFYEDSLTLIVSPSERQSKEMLRVCKHVRDALGVSVKPDKESTTHMEFPWGSRIVALPSKEQNLRGLAGVDLLIVDEASRVPDDLYKAIRPMLAVSGGRLFLLSTPFGKRGFFYEEWENGGPGWKRISVRADQCPRIAPSFLEEERRSLGPVFFRQEYMCEFAEMTNSVFSFEDIQAALSDDVKPLFPAAESMESEQVKPLFQ